MSNLATAIKHVLLSLGGFVTGAMAMHQFLMTLGQN